MVSASRRSVECRSNVPTVECARYSLSLDVDALNRLLQVLFRATAGFIEVGVFILYAGSAFFDLIQISNFERRSIYVAAMDFSRFRYVSL